MKLTAEQAIQFLSSLGVSGAELVENETDSDFNRESALSEIDNSRMPVLKSKYEAEWTPEFEKKISGKVGGTLETLLSRKFGIPRKNLQGDGLSDSEKIDMAIQFHSEQSGKTESALQDEIRKMISEKESLLSTHENALKEVENTWRGKFNQKEINAQYRSALDKAPISQRADKEALTADFAAYMANKYHLSYNEALKAVEYFQKDNPAIPAQSESASGKIDLNTEMEQYFKPRGLWEVSTANNEMPKFGEAYKPNNATPTKNTGRLTPAQAREQRQLAAQAAGLVQQ